jgi:hypothetical protein
MNPLTGIRIRSGQVPSPDIDWDKQPKVWVSLKTVRLDGGFVFSNALLPVDALFAESNTRPTEVRLVEMPGAVLGVLQGEVEVVRALLDGKSGLEARRYRL